jgi:hypothetical protein
MTPEMTQPQQGGSNEQIADRILTIMGQLIQTAGPEWVLQFLLEGLRSARGDQQSGQGAPAPDQGMAQPDMDTSANYNKMARSRVYRA